MAEPRNELPATLFGLGEKGESTPVRVRFLPSAIEITVKDQGPLRLTYGSVTMELGPDDEFWVFKGHALGKDLLVYINEESLPDIVRSSGAHPSVIERIDKLASVKEAHTSWQMVTLALFLLFIVVILAGMYAGVPILLDMAIDRIPVDWEVSLGAAAAGDITRSYSECMDPELNTALAEVTDRLVTASGDQPYTFNFTIIDTEMVNAFALPGGRMFVTYGLLNATNDPHEVAGVLGHEMAHVTERHGLRNVVANAGIKIMVAIIIGGTDSDIVELAPLAGQLSALAFSREQEREADYGGLEILYAAKLDPDGLPRFFDRLAGDDTSIEGFMEVVSTHPMSAERATELRSVISSRPAPTITPLATDWSTLEKLCRPLPVEGGP